jgi:hypothetical protein
MTAPILDPYGFPPRGMDRAEAARWVGVGTTKFDQMVQDGRMPRAKRVDGRMVWDRYQLDRAFTDLPDADGNRIDRALGRVA